MQKKQDRKDEQLFQAFVDSARRDSVEAPTGFEQRVLRGLRQRKHTVRDKTIWRLIPALGALVVLIVMLVPLFLNQQDSSNGADHSEKYSQVCFSLQHPHAKQVALVGDFNQWQNRKDYLVFRNGHWTICKQLEKGRFYKYAFVVNDKKIVNDPTVKRTVDDGFGGQTSVVFVN